MPKDTFSHCAAQFILGVMICGCVGVGKSSLAREVCYKLSNNSEPWQITRVNLRYGSKQLHCVDKKMKETMILRTEFLIVCTVVRIKSICI